MFVDYYNYFLTEKIEKGNRNNTLYRAALAAFAMSKPLDPIISKALEIGLEEDEIHYTVNSARRAHQENRNVYTLWYKPVDINSYINEFGEAFTMNTLALQFRRQVSKMFEPNDLVLVSSLNDKVVQEIFTLEELLDPEFVIPENAVFAINPVSSKNCTGKISDIVRFNYMLLETDKIDLDEQYKFLSQCGLPIDFIVFSGNRSLHAFIRIDAPDLETYRERVKIIEGFLKSKNYPYDKSVLQPAARGRLAGSIRNGVPQCIVSEFGDTSYYLWEKERQKQGNISIKTWDEVCRYVEYNPQPPSIINGILQERSVMLLAGEPKVGKTMLLLNLLSSMSCGRDWLGRKTTEKKCLFVNLEVDEYTIFNRMKSIIDQNNTNTANIFFMNLRGLETDYDSMTQKIYENIKSKGIDVVIIDPIYRLFNGNENSIQELTRFISVIDKTFIANGVSVICSHHLNKGVLPTGDVLRGLNRVSGSNVLLRWADTIIIVYKSSGKHIDIEYYCRSFGTSGQETYTFEYPNYKLFYKIS